jgi:hypothetical protein
MSRTYQLHVDTSSTASGTVIKTSNNPFACTVKLGQTHRRLQAVALKSVELPVAFYNIRAPYNTFTITNSGVTTVYTVTPGNYTVTSLISALNGIIGSGTGSFAPNSMTSRLTYTSVVGSVSFPVVSRTLGYFLGFTDGQSGTVITATNSYNINFDNYINIFIENLRNSSLEPNVPITFKVPITVANGSVEYFFEGIRFPQSICIRDPDFTIDRLNISVRDRFGQPLDNNGVDWTFTLEFISDT